MGHFIKLESASATIGAYLAEPTGTPKGGVVVIQEIFGVNTHIREVADRYAQAGYTAIAPALFDHVEKDVELEYNEAGLTKGIDLVGKLGFDLPVEDVKAAAAYISKAGKVGTVGYCWGGSVAYLSAIRLGLPGVSYYGGRNVLFVDQQAKAPLMFHYAALDAHISADDRAKVIAANPNAPVYVYDADHGFNCDHRGSYNPAAAALAQERTLAFFQEHLGA
ncbi:MAG: dienelactone hydrolase family protein [Dyella sp.]